MADSSAPPSPRETRSVLLFVLAILASAFLIFLVQPMVGKRILPWFGGTPAVWMVCLAFYQTALFLGYAYAHLLIRFASPGRQLVIHAGVVVAALLVQPVLPGDLWRPAGIGRPVQDILTLLGANVAIPFLLLASTGPLVQAWFSRLHPTTSPYPLYAVSNAGSLLALLAFPFVLEPSFGLSDIGSFWTASFVVTVALILACGVLTWRGAPAAARTELAGDDAMDPLDGLRVMLWLLLSASGVMLLMGITNRLCLDVANVPFLWILPLALYLLTLIFAFGSEAIYKRWLFVALAFVLLVKTLGAPLWAEPFVDSAWFTPFQDSLPAKIVSYGGLLFCVAMLMHGELYRLRPAPRALTSFYLCVAGGGAIGGLFVGLAAPLLFDDYHEFALSLILAWLLIPLARIYDRSVREDTTARLWPSLLVAALAVIVTAYTSIWDASIGKADDRLVHQERTFFGVLRVHEFDRPRAQRILMHGYTLHGVQFTDATSAGIPTSYYGRATPIGLLLDSRPEDRETRIGVVGLGAGTLAAYGRPQDLIRFYEIDESVIRLASDSLSFSYLGDSAATIEHVAGDARLELARESDAGTRQDFDILVIDAFSSDGVPVHLLTLEALDRYARALAPGGLIALHVSTNHLDLLSQVVRQGKAAGYGVLSVSSEKQPNFYSQRTDWVFLAPDRDDLQPLADRLRQARASLGIPPAMLLIKSFRSDTGDDLRVWTDEQSDVFSLLRGVN